MAKGKVVSIHDINSDENLANIRKTVGRKAPNASIHAGFFWVIKGAKQCYELEFDIDFQKAKDAYNTIKGQVKDLKLAVCIFQSSATSETKETK